MNQAHIDSHKQLSSWINEKENYLNTKEVIQSVGEAKTQLSLLDSFEKDKQGKEHALCGDYIEYSSRS
jgi:hypothetical protein